MKYAMIVEIQGVGGDKDMKIIQPSIEILTPLDGDYILKFLEKCGRTCYKSENKILLIQQRSLSVT